MSSAQVAMTSPSANVYEREGRPALGHFLSKFGSAKTRSKSPTVTLSLKCKTNTTPPKGSTHIDLTKEDFHNAEDMPHCGVRFSQQATLINNESNMNDVDASRTPPSKPKRTSSPFARVLNRLSMSRKRFNSVSNEHIHEISPETLCQKTPLTTTASPSCIATSPRPAISESDLRHITLHRGQLWISVSTDELYKGYSKTRKKYVIAAYLSTIIARSTQLVGCDVQKLSPDVGMSRAQISAYTVPMSANCSGTVASVSTVLSTLHNSPHRVHTRPLRNSNAQ